MCAVEAERPAPRGLKKAAVGGGRKGSRKAEAKEGSTADDRDSDNSEPGACELHAVLRSMRAVAWARVERRFGLG